MIAIFKTACLMGAASFLKSAHVVAQPMLAPVAWGRSTHGGTTTYNNNEDITGMTQVSCGGHACVGLKTDGSAVAWGSSGYGGDDQGNDLTDMAQVVCGGSACAGLKKDGLAVAWGHGGAGGDITFNNNEDATGVAQVVCGGLACVGLKTGGSIITWGSIISGGSDQGNDLTDMAQVVCGNNACAGLKTDGLVIAWGNNAWGGDVQNKDVTDVVQVACGGQACAGLKTGGSVIVWGHSAYGGDDQGNDMTDMVQVVCGNNACAGLKTDGSVIAWGDIGKGGDVQNKDVTDIAQVVCGGHACAGLKKNGSVVVWGDSDKGGDDQGNNMTDMAQIACGYYACAGLKMDGSVVAWGSNAHGGDLQNKVIVGANQITCGDYACVAWYDPDTAGGGGDPHFIGFGGIYFTWQGHCDLVMVKSKDYINGNSCFEVHIRTTRIRKWSKIDMIAIKVGQDVGEISSRDGKFILNGHEANTVQTQALTVTKSNPKRNIILYNVKIEGDKKLEIRVNTRSQMIVTSFSGNYSRNIEGILGSPHQTGLLSRNGDYIPITNVNKFAETWQVSDRDSRLFNTDRTPQYPSKCIYDVKKTTSSHRNRHLKELHIVPVEDAVDACAVHRPGPLQKFCVDDVIMSGDLDSAKDEFYE